jgi:hypothetical protein
MYWLKYPHFFRNFTRTPRKERSKWPEPVLMRVEGDPFRKRMEMATVPAREIIQHLRMTVLVCYHAPCTWIE